MTWKSYSDLNEMKGAEEQEASDMNELENNQFPVQKNACLQCSRHSTHLDGALLVDDEQTAQSHTIGGQHTVLLSNLLQIYK